MLVKDIKNRFAYHRATKETALVHSWVREEFTEFAYKLNDVLPDGREKSLMLTALQEAMMWGNAAIAMNDMIDDEHPELPNDPGA